MSALASWKQHLSLTAHSTPTGWPGIAQLRRKLYEARFRAGRYHCGYSGRYASFEAAERALPTGLSGFDHDAMADIGHYTTMAGGIEPMPATEYPVLLWLRGALDQGARTLLDLGGYVGHAFRQYDQYLAFPDDFRWTVFDLPHITRAGQALAAQQPTPRLRFSNSIDDGCGLDILLAATHTAPWTALLRDDPVGDHPNRAGFVLSLQRPGPCWLRRQPAHARVRARGFLGEATQPRRAIPSGMPCRDLFGPLLPAEALTPAHRDLPACQSFRRASLG
jgi:hypothetical protein